jgi:hypothetical protein
MVDPGQTAPMAFRFPREIEVGTIMVWPDARVWAAVGVLESRRTTDQLAFICATGMRLPVADRRVSPDRRNQATAIAIAVVAATCGLPMPCYGLECSRGGFEGYWKT